MKVHAHNSWRQLNSEGQHLKEEKSKKNPSNGVGQIKEKKNEKTI